MKFGDVWTDVAGLDDLALMKRIKAVCPSEDQFKAEESLFPLIGPVGAPYRVLDFGCGMGRNLKGMAQHSSSWHVTGYDNPAMLARAAEYLGGEFGSQWSLSSDWEVLRTQKFDVIVVSLVLQHMETEDVRTALRDFATMAPRVVILSRGHSDFQADVRQLIAQGGDWVAEAMIFDPDGCHPGHWLGRFLPALEVQISTFPPFNDAFQAVGQRIHDKGVFVGCPLSDFTRISRDQLIVLLMEGLNPESYVLDIGCGCLRAGVWLIHFLEAGRYFGIEPNTRALEAAAEFNQVFEVPLAKKSPTFSTIDTFELETAFSQAVQFDFVTGLSVWSHAPKWAILKMLDGFVRCRAPGGKFVTSYFPAAKPEGDYRGAEWVGKSHESNQAGVVGHSPQWLREECRARGLEMNNLPVKILGQQWVCIQ
jgi:SAM-dependent methyltransferase